MSTSTTSTCIATTKSGAACRVRALPGSDLCWFHDPDRAVERKEARSKGGRARHGRRLGTTNTGDPLEIHSLEDVSRLIVEEINMARGLEKSISRARCVGYLAGVLVTVYKESELEQRIVALEAAQGARQ